MLAYTPGSLLLFVVLKNVVSKLPSLGRGVVMLSKCKWFELTPMLSLVPEGSQAASVCMVWGSV